MDNTAIQPNQPQSSPTAIDWKLVRDLYLQEVPHKEISARTGASLGAIRCRAYRHGWKDETHNELLTNPPPIQELIQEWQVNMALAMISGSRFWANWDADLVRSGKDAKDWEQAKQFHVQSGRMLFGLDQQSASGPSWGRGGPTGPVIDVTPVPLKPAS